ncbi:RHS repeat domain-containing protein [Chryseobacterium sp. R2A-55]|uniref:RHS repeat domain-containing protein n=1 Tax=Chryseobacterium sp. R2A-55 TaxID=2744445 RepID=UPI001F457804|nr:RHS repeat-associated core domain-containing protein [Chryseobacterium sp. R2A-55]
MPTAEGFYSFTENRYIYQYKDHLGNVRVSFTKNQSGGTDVLDTNDYYPFGMNHLNPDQESFFGASSYKNYKFGGKELQETGFYDFGARFYISDIAIFGTHDPMSEKTMQPYAYAYNNPMKFADPTGMEGEAANNDSVETGSGGQEDAGGFGGFEGPANGRGCPPNCPEFINKGKPIDIDEVVVTGKKNEGAAASSNSGTNFSFSNIGNSISNLWNSNFARGIVPDKITLSHSQSLTVYIGETTDISLNWITRGNDSQIIPYAIFTAGGHGGGRASADALVNIGAGTYLISDMRNLPKGQARDALLGWSAYGTASVGFVAGGSITGSVGFSGSPLISKPTWVSGAIGGGASIGGGITGGISYSYPVIKSQFK